MRSRTVLQRDWWSMQHSASRNASTTSKFSLLTMILLTASRKPGTVRTYMHTHPAPKLICCPICCPGALNVTHVRSPFFLPRSLFGLFHILFAHLQRLYLMLHLLFMARRCDTYIVDQLSTCIPSIRVFLGSRVVFYCHSPDKLLANGEYIDNDRRQELGFARRRGFLKRIYRFPMDYWEGLTTSQADLLLANSEFTAKVVLFHFPLPNGSQESYILESISRSTNPNIWTQMLRMLSCEFPLGTDRPFAELWQETNPLSSGSAA
jgi:hypothetical protein